MGGDSSDIAVFLVVLALRFVIPLFIPRFPLPAILAALVLDAADQTIFQQFTNLNLDGYQNYDKALDIFYLTIAFLAVYRNWTNTTAINVARFLWYYRLVGVWLFEVFQERWLLFVFPNTFEYFFIAYVAIRTQWDPRRLDQRSRDRPRGVHLDLHQAAPGMVDPHRPERLHRLHEGRHLRHDPDHARGRTRSPTGRR